MNKIISFVLLCALLLIYLNSTDDKVIYYSTSAYDNSLKTMRCVL